jgi:uncharacterized protein YceK
MRLVWLALIVAVLAGCGSGGGGAAGSAVEPSQAQVTVALSTEASNAATVLYAVQLTLRLPAGVAVAADPASVEVSAGVLHPADSAALAGARYQPATAGAQGSLTVNIVDPTGFTVGALATLSCSIAPGTALNGAGFTLEGFSAKDLNGVSIPGVTARLTLQTQ